jgi:arylsulfatase A-like enzyme
MLDEAGKREIRRGIRIGHYGLLSLIDEQIGNVMDALEEENQLDETMVIFTSDHGSALFDNEMLHKGSAFPTQSIVPFIVWYPDLIEPGFSASFTNHADLFSTFLDLAGAAEIPGNEGHSFTNIMLNPDKENEEFTIVECTMVSSIMTKEWLAGFHHMTGEKELYNLTIDSMCHYNLAGQAEYEQILESLKLKLTDWRKSKSKPGEVVNNELFEWFEELGDTTEIQKYYKGYINEFQRLVQMPDSAVGVTGRDAYLRLQIEH